MSWLTDWLTRNIWRTVELCCICVHWHNRRSSAPRRTDTEPRCVEVPCRSHRHRTGYAVVHRAALPSQLTDPLSTHTHTHTHTDRQTDGRTDRQTVTDRQTDMKLKLISWVRHCNLTMMNSTASVTSTANRFSMVSIGHNRSQQVSIGHNKSVQVSIGYNRWV